MPVETLLDVGNVFDRSNGPDGDLPLPVLVGDDSSVAIHRQRRAGRAERCRVSNQR